MNKNAEEGFDKSKGTNNACLPPDLALLTDKDRSKFLSALEVDPNPKSSTYGKSFLCVHAVLVPSEEDANKTFDLKNLFTLPLRTLCRNMGITNCGSKNKFECRRAITAFLNYQEKLEANGLKPRSHAGRLTSTLCRAVNVVFNEQFIESFKTVNDAKTRRDHETYSTSQQAFLDQCPLAHNHCGECDRIQRLSPTDTACATIDAADDNNDGADDFSSIYIPENSATDPHLQELLEDEEINLLEVSQFDTEAFRKKITDLFHVRRIMIENMTTSGKHDSDPWNFVEAAMNKAKKSGLTKLSVYYFYVRCNEHPNLDSQFQPFLDSILRGDTVALSSGEDEVYEYSTAGSLSSSSIGNSPSPSAAVGSTASSNTSHRSKKIKKTSTRKPATTSTSSGKKKTKIEGAAEYQQLVVSALALSQAEFREYMVKQDEFLDRMTSDAKNREERSKLQLRFELAKAMGDMEEM